MPIEPFAKSNSQDGRKQSINDPETPADSGAPGPMVPHATVARLALYLRELQQLGRSGSRTIKSNVLGSRLGLTDSQVRRDLAYFGQFGRRGVGYDVKGLTQSIREILGTNQNWNVILIGVGNLGRALIGYRGFDAQGFKLVAAFDSDPAKLGQKIGGIRVNPISRLEKVINENDVQLAILAVPAESAPGIAARLADAGVTGILNFAPVTMRPENPNVKIFDVDLAIELQRLAFAVVKRTTSG